MRIKKEMVNLISSKLAHSLLGEEHIIYTEEPAKLEKLINGVITEDLMVEIKLNEEVKQIMTSHASEMDRNNVEYGRMFQMIKKKLVRERDLVL